MSDEVNMDIDLQLRLLENASTSVIKLYKVLKSVEWSGERRGEGCCPSCLGYHDDGHFDFCDLMEAISEAEGKDK